MMVRPLDEWFDVTAVRYIDGYRMLLNFSDGFVREIDFEPVLVGDWLGALRDIDLFKRVAVNHDTGTIEWPNGVDFNPVVLHDWPDYVGNIIERLEKNRDSSAVLA